ncbi:LamG domain-containing protein [Streptomyces sp. 549]|nr:LamG domain-containing protein [Streptomyces sp. 549]
MLTPDAASAAASPPLQEAGDGSGTAPPRSPEQDALDRAKKSGEPVEVEALRSESSEVFATPEGALEAREHLRPVWARVKGEWKPVDTDLVKLPGGGVGPKVATLDIRFSGGGADPLVRMDRAGRELALSWPHRLPAPVLQGEIATYPEVLPGVDLRMGAHADGFTQLLVVKSAEAAKSEELTELRLKLGAQGMDVRTTETGGLEAIDKGAKTPVFEAATPLMWDSSGGTGDTGQPQAKSSKVLAPAASGPEQGTPAGESGKQAPVAVDLPAGRNELVLTPDAGLLRGADTQYPVYIDPQWYSPRAAAWTMASKYWANSPQWKFNGDPDGGLGYCGWAYCQPQDTKRLFYRIPTSRFSGKSVLSAEFVVRNVHSASCDARSVQLWRTGAISDKTTWNSQNASGFWIKQLASRSFAHGHNGCAAKDAEFNVKAAVQEAANKKWSTMTFGLRASSETDRYGWKRFSDRAFLRVQYNRPPPQVKMSQLAMEYGGTCRKPASAARVRTLGKIYANNVTDPDGDSVSVQFQAKWASTSGGTPTVQWQPARTAAKKSGSSFAIKLPTNIPANRTVHWYVRSYDGAQYSPWSHAGDPTGCYFVYDTSVPKAPSIVSAEYPESDPENPDDPWLDGVGQYGDFTFKASAGDVNRYWYGVNSDPVQSNQISTSAGAARTVKVLPSKPGVSFVTAMALDTAGNRSEARTYQFRVKAGQPERATWQLNEDSGATQASGSAPSRETTLKGGAEITGGGAKGNGLSLDGVDGHAASDVPIVDTNRGFSVAAWVKLDRKPTGAAATVASQPGNHNVGFELYYSSAFDRWIFNQYETDQPGSKIVRAMADQPGGVSTGTWTHLAGTFDGVGKQLKLYVNGSLAGQTALPNAWNARRGLHIGAGASNGVPNNFFPGMIDELQMFDKPISTGEIATLRGHGRVGDPGRPAVALFDMEAQTDSGSISGPGDVLPAVYQGGVTTGVPGIQGNAAEFNGTTGHAKIGQSSGPHVNTSRSFTIAAWAKLSRKPTGAAIITAQTGRHRPGFELYYSSAYDRWAFNQYSADSPDASVIRAMQPAGTTAQVGDWVHLVGVHDTVAETLTLYVNGRAVGSTQLGSAFYADQSMFIGAGAYGGSPTNHFPGTIDDVRLFDRPVSAAEAQQVFKQRAMVKGRWMFDKTEDADPLKTPDDSEVRNPMTLHGQAEIGFDSMLGSGALQLNGVNAHAATTKVPVDTSGSFTATAWVKAAAQPSDPVALFSTEGVQRDGFGVRYVPHPTDPVGYPGHWQLSLTDADEPGASVVQTDNGNVDYVTQWTHIAFVYDGFQKEARLYVDGDLAEIGCPDEDSDGNADGGCTELVPWAENALSFKATRSFQVGRFVKSSAQAKPFPGVIDDVWLFQGALTDTQVENLADMWFDVPTKVPGD